MNLIRGIVGARTLLIAVLILSVGGWFGYTAWQNSKQAAAEWRSADQEMQQMLKDQAELRLGKSPSDGGTVMTGKQEPTIQAGAQQDGPQSAAGNQPEPSQLSSTTESSGKNGNTAKPGASTAKETPAAGAKDTHGGQAKQAGQPKQAGQAKQAGGKVSLNTATAEQLKEIPGIGESKAKAIIAYRKQIGGRFQSAQQLLEVKGIGEKLLAKMEPHLTVEP